jgi:hypothetical protein
MTALYSVRNWDRFYEKAQSRKVKGPLDWVAMPTTHDGKRYRRLVALPNAAELLGAWLLIVEVAGKCKTHGILEDHDGPITSEDLAFKTGIPSTVFDRALQVFSGKEINWLSRSMVVESPAVVAPQDRTGQDITGQDITKPDSDSGPPSAPGPAPSAPRKGPPPPDPVPASGSESGFFKDVDEEMLRSEAQTDAWFQAGKERFGKLVSSHDRHQVHAMAVHALRIGKKPVSVFVRNVKAGDFKAITDEDSDEASERIRRLDAPRPGAVSSAAGATPALRAMPTDPPPAADRQAEVIRQIKGISKQEAIT